MKLFRSIGIVFVIIILTSCTKNTDTNKANNNTVDTTTVFNEDIPMAFEDKGISDNIKSYSRLGGYEKDPVSSLFSDYLKSDEVLEAEIERFYALNEKAEEKNKHINEFVRNNDRYYKAAEELLKSIKDNDTLVHYVLLSKLKESQLRYSEQRTSLTAMSESKQSIYIEWNNYLNAVKILKTLEMVEKYQAVDAFDQGSFEDVLDEQQSLTTKLKERVN